MNESKTKVKENEWRESENDGRGRQYRVGGYLGGEHEAATMRLNKTQQIGADLYARDTGKTTCAVPYGNWKLAVEIAHVSSAPSKLNTRGSEVNDD